MHAQTAHKNAQRACRRLTDLDPRGKSVSSSIAEPLHHKTRNEARVKQLLGGRKDNGAMSGRVVMSRGGARREVKSEQWLEIEAWEREV